jgi:hypothetical protein
LGRCSSRAILLSASISTKNEDKMKRIVMIPYLVRGGKKQALEGDGLKKGNLFIEISYSSKRLDVFRVYCPQTNVYIGWDV